MKVIEPHVEDGDAKQVVGTTPAVAVNVPAPVVGTPSEIA
jgi:hypothetical protein